ncbi:hypothetical protein PLICRDRAFT_570609 [Plicaturopsis crispa FD-325 SS-3]|nr:hypothetical protein PLICRDRAFT_570609 [Plicaturopsis crispa FD-325 SS-3]
MEHSTAWIFTRWTATFSLLATVHATSILLSTVWQPTVQNAYPVSATHLHAEPVYLRAVPEHHHADLVAQLHTCCIPRHEGGQRRALLTRLTKRHRL